MIRRLTAGLLGAAAVAASMVVLRTARAEVDVPQRVIPPGETVPAEIHIDRLRELGI